MAITETCTGKSAFSLKLTWDVSVSILQSMKIIHELADRNLESLKECCVFKEPVRDLRHTPNLN